MTLKNANIDRLRYVLTWGIDQSELQLFFKQKKKALILAGEKLQNLPEYPTDRIAAVLRFCAKANSLFARWCQEKIVEGNLKSAEEIVARYQQAESDGELLGDEEKRLLSRSILVHLVQNDSPDVLLSFICSSIGGDDSDDGDAAANPGSEQPDIDSDMANEFTIRPDDLSALANVILAHRPSLVELNSYTYPDLLRFVLAIRFVREKNWESLAKIESELPEGSVYKDTLDATLNRLRADSPHGVVNLLIREVATASEIDLEAIQVIAECTFVHPDGYVFFEPIFLLDSDGLIRCSHKVFTDLFPNNGTVMAFTDQLSRVPDVHSLGAWIVESRDTDKPVKVHVRAFAEPIFEVIEIGVSSDDYEQFRTAIFSSKYSNTGRAIFRTTDNLLIRPRRDIADIAREGMKEPFDAWPSMPGFVVEGRTFVVGPLPPAKMTYDCSPPDQLLSHILSLVNDVEGAPKLTKVEIRTIVDAARDTITKVDPARISDVREHLENYLLATENLKGIMDQIIQNPKVQREIQEAKANATVQALSVRDDLKRDIRNLQEERAGLEKSIRQREIEQQQLPAKVGRAVRKAFTKAKDEGIDGLGEVAVLAQLLRIGQAGIQSPVDSQRASEPELVWSPVEPEGGSLEDVFAKYGVVGERAAALDCAVRIAAAAGLIVIVEGVAANAVADATARTLATKPGVSTTVSIGVYGHDQLKEHVAKLGETTGVLVLKMANHSDINTYGSELLDYAIKRLAEKRTDLPLIVLTLSDGPSALPIPMRLRQLAMSVDLDSLGVQDSASGPDSLRDMIEEAENTRNLKLWLPLRKRLNDAFDAIAKKPNNEVVSLIRTGFIDRALTKEKM